MARSGTSSALRAAAALALSASVAPASALCLFPQVVSVGADPTCDASDIQSGIDAVVDDPSCPAVVAITGAQWNNQHLSIADKSLKLTGFGDGVTCDQTGGIDACGLFGDCPTATKTTLSASGSGRVLSITGASSVTLRFLMVSSGDVGGADGGAIRYDGSGTLWLDTTTVNLSHAANGGGIAFHASAAGAALRLLPYAQILANTAEAGSGGGIYVSGPARLFALSPQTWIAVNHAPNGNGGGIALAGSARADIGSPGFNGAGVVGYNDAANGGGVAIEPDDDASATLRIFTTDPQHPVLIENNSATDHGGAVHVAAAQFAPGHFCAFDFRIADNAASDGAAIYASSRSYTFDPDNGGEVSFNALFGGDPCGPESPPALGAVDCAAGVECSVISGNLAVDEHAVPTAGAVITLESAAPLLGDPVAFRGNAGAQLIRATGNNAEFVTFDVLMRNCLVAGNHTQHELLSVRDGRDLALNGCTIAGNTIDNGYQIYADVGDKGLTLVNSIFDQPGVSVLDYNGDNALRGLSYLIANETATLAGALNSQGNTPVYVDAAHGDYHLALNSPGVDYAPSQAGSDLDGLPRTVDLAPVANLYGPRDLGAYERQGAFACDGAADAIFCSAFEP